MLERREGNPTECIPSRMLPGGVRTAFFAPAAAGPGCAINVAIHPSRKINAAMAGAPVVA